MNGHFARARIQRHTSLGSAVYQARCVCGWAGAEYVDAGGGAAFRSAEGEGRAHEGEGRELVNA